MSYYKPDRLNRVITLATQVATGIGLLYAAPMIAGAFATGAPLGAMLWSGGLGSGLLLGSVSLAGLVSATRAGEARSEADTQIKVIREAAAQGKRPILPASRAFDLSHQPSGLWTGLAKAGGTLFMLAGGLSATIGGSWAMGLWPSLGLAAIGFAAYKSGDVAEQARDYAQTEIEAARKRLAVQAKANGNGQALGNGYHPANDRPPGFSHVDRLEAERMRTPANGKLFQ